MEFIIIDYHQPLPHHIMTYLKPNEHLFPASLRSGGVAVPQREDPGRFAGGPREMDQLGGRMLGFGG